MYYVFVSQCLTSFKQIDSWLDKAQAYAQANKIDVNVLMAGRLAADMKPFTYQVQSASDYVKAAAGWLTGTKPPSFTDDENTIDQLRERVRKTIAFAESVPESAYAQTSDRLLSLPWKKGKVMVASDYLTQITIPNVFFHLAIGYAILRHQGVALGKMDFLGSLNFIDPP